MVSETGTVMGGVAEFWKARTICAVYGVPFAGSELSLVPTVKSPPALPLGGLISNQSPPVICVIVAVYEAVPPALVSVNA